VEYVVLPAAILYSLIPTYVVALFGAVNDFAAVVLSHLCSVSLQHFLQRGKRLIAA
jgi:hypothetical protein